MKWFLAALVAANMVVALLGMLSRPTPVDIKSRESNASQIQLAGQGSEPSPLEALTMPKPGSALAAAQEEAARHAQTPAPAVAPVSPPVTSLAAALAPEAAKPAAAPEAPPASHAEHKPAIPKPEPLKEAGKPMPSPSGKAEPAPQNKPADKKTESARLELAGQDKPADKKADTKPRLTCYQAVELDAAAASKLKAALNKAGLAARMRETVEETGRTGGKFWVYLPSYANRDEALKQSAALKEKGFDNYVVNAEGENRNSLSMGLFSQEDSAKAMVKRLADSGYSARLTPRGGTAVTRATVRVDGLDEAASTALGKSGVSMKPVSCKP